MEKLLPEPFNGAMLRFLAALVRTGVLITNGDTSRCTGFNPGILNPVAEPACGNANDRAEATSAPLRPALNVASFWDDADKADQDSMAANAVM